MKIMKELKSGSERKATVKIMRKASWEKEGKKGSR